MGFALLSASDSNQRTVVASAVADLVTNKFVPALASQAAREAVRAYAGRYVNVATNGLNSSLTLAVNLTAGAPPGLVITSWVSSGTNVLAWLPRYFGRARLFRLVPSMTDKETGIAGKVAFQLVATADEQPGRVLFSDTPDWITADVSTYFGIGLSLFVIDIDGTGKATAVSPAAWRVKLSRVE